MEVYIPSPHTLLQILDRQFSLKVWCLKLSTATGRFGGGQIQS